VKKLFAIILLAASAVQAQDITGAGATFPAPLYARWSADYYKTTGQKVNYQSIGSGAGLKQIEARTVAFGASDMPLTDDKLKSLGLFQFPTVIGGVVPIVNIKGISPGQLKLSGPILGDIYLGKITRWNDAAIKVTNPTVTLPNEDIIVVRRADGSGTTFIWTNYLSKVNQEFKNKLGEGTAINWIVGIGGKGNEGVAAFVSKLPNSIGYVEYAYVKQNKMTYVQVQNSTGNWITPTEEAFKAAGAAADWSKSYYQILTNQGDRAAWPIAGATFILVPEKSEKLEQVKLSVKFFDWAYTNGDKAADDLDYVALPLAVKNKIRADWRRLGLN
jgi:phosphate transport system substrate-binding protein